MDPTSRDFLRAAGQRLETAEFLFESRRTLDAMYLGGYVIECSVKALILELTPASDRSATLMRIRTHNLERLIGFLKDLGVLIPVELAARIRKSRWSTDLRYQTGREDTGRTRWYLNTAIRVRDWVEGQFP